LCGRCYCNPPNLNSDFGGAKGVTLADLCLPCDADIVRTTRQSE
jgi:hypothetical protein